MNSYDIAKIIKKSRTCDQTSSTLTLFIKNDVCNSKNISFFYAEYISLLYVEFT